MPFIFGTYHKKSVRFKNECIEDQDLLNDVSALARGEQTLLKVKAKGELSVDSYAPLTVSEGGGFIEEPDPGFGAKYPHNKTFTTRTGHAVEIDDTPGAERIHIYHRMGTYSEMYANGDRVQKIIGDDYEIVCKDKKLLVRGNLSIETDAAATILVKDNAHIWVGGNVTQVVEKNVDQLVKGNVREEIEGSKDVYVHGDLNYVVGGNMSYAVEGTAEINSMGDMSFRTSAMQNFYVEGNQTVYIQGSQNITIVSSKIEYAQSGTVIYGSGLLYIVSGEVIATTTPLTLHVHMDTPGYGMGVTTPPIF
jgi:hypothetical protein